MPSQGRESFSPASAWCVHRLGEVDRDREPDALRGACLGGVDADDVAGGVEQRAAAVAGVDRGVGLDEVVEVGRR